jgi:hypothetical protein
VGIYILEIECLDAQKERKLLTLKLLTLNVKEEGKGRIMKIN